MDNDPNKEAVVPLLNQKVQSLEKHLDRLGESHRDLVAKTSELIVIVRMDGANIADNIKKIDRNHQTLINRIWALLGAVIISIVISGLDVMRK